MDLFGEDEDKNESCLVNEEDMKYFFDDRQ